MWKCGTRECAHIAVLNFSFPYVLSHSQPLLSLFNFLRNSSAAPSAALVLFVPVPSACVTLIYSATQTAPSLARRTRSSFALLSKTLVQCPMCHFHLTAPRDPKCPDHRVCECSCFHTARKQEQTAPSCPPPPAVVNPHHTQLVWELYCALLLQKLHYFYKICCSTFNNALWRIINN